jgi:CheY-like chemotaxis protein
LSSITYQDIENKLIMTRKYKVFVVDDEPMVRKMLEFKLKNREDLEIQAFSSGESCVKNLHQRPNIIILDYHMDTNKENAMVWKRG